MLWRPVNFKEKIFTPGLEPRTSRCLVGRSASELPSLGRGEVIPSLSIIPQGCYICFANCTGAPVSNDSYARNVTATLLCFKYVIRYSVKGYIIPASLMRPCITCPLQKARLADKAKNSAATKPCYCFPRYIVPLPRPW